MIKLNCFMYDWSYCDEESEDDNGKDCLKTFIRGYGITEKNKSVYLLIEHYTPYLRIQLPTTIDNEEFKWDDVNVKFVYNKLVSLCRRQDFKPIKYKLEYKRKLYFVHKTKINGKYYDKVFPYLLLVFNSLKALSTFTYVLKKPIDIIGVGMNLTFKSHESDYNASPILKMTAIRKIPLSGWISVIGKEIKINKESTFREIACDYKNLNPVDINSVPRPLILYFDGEMNSKNISAMPNFKLKEDVVFQIGCIISRNIQFDSKNNKYRKILLTLGSVQRFNTLSKRLNTIINKYLNDKNNFEIRSFKNEAKLLLGFRDLINEINPNIIAGYNIFGFDIEYLYERAKYNGIENEFLKFSCIPKIPSYVYDKDKWESKAYGKQNIIRIVSEGRLFIDILPFIQRNYKLVNYKLDTVAKYFKVGAKDPLKPKDIFRCYREYTSQSLFCCGSYCIQDSLVTAYIFEIIYMWVSLTEEAKTNKVPIVFLYTKGQQIKMYSQVYNYCMYHNYVVESNAYEAKSDEHYTGALVLEPKKGKWNLIASLDFASLYPSIMIAKNIDYSTCVKDDDIPDEDCHVFCWDEHINCIHDKKYVEKEGKKQARKKKIEQNKKIREQKLKEKNDKKLFEQELLRINNNEAKSFIDLLSETDEELQMIDKRKLNIKEREIKNEELSIVKLNLEGEKGKEHSPPLKKVCGSFKYRFIKSEVSEKGVIPTLLENLLNARKQTRNQLKEINEKIKKLEKDGNNNELESLKTLSIVLEKRQLSYKVSANSMYGAMGVKKGYLPFLPGAMCVTFVGRQSIAKTVKIVEEKYQGEVIYGDSVVKDTPILCKYNDHITYKCIEEIGNEIKDNEWKSYHNDKEYRNTDLLVWSDKGFTKINKVIRHKTNKKIFRTLIHTGVVDTTEDHSLLNNNKEKISPKDIKIGTELLIHNLPIKGKDFGVKDGNTEIIILDEENKNKLDYIITSHEAFVWGLFWADGSCGSYNTKHGIKYSWAINNQDYKLLEKCKFILEEVENQFEEFKILDTMKSSNVYKLVPYQGNNYNSYLKELVLKYRPLMYYSEERTGENKDIQKSYKYIPDIILNAPYNIRKSFLDGYYAGDGDKGGNYRFDNLGKIGSAGLYYLAHSINYKVSINTRLDKQEIYRITCTKNNPKRNENKVKKIYEIKDYNDYVYDLETENHHFSAGIGKLIVHNTDSVMVKFKEENIKKLCDIARDISRYSQEVFPSPMKLEFEGKLYFIYLLFSKKRYALIECDENGIVNKEIKSKGIILQRRDNSKFLKQLYKSTIQFIFDGKTLNEVLDNINDHINKLFSRSYSYKDFTITKSLTRDDYKVKPGHALLAEKMRKRGISVPVGSKISYIITTQGGNNYKTKQSDKIVDEDYFAEWKEILRVDFLYLLEKQALIPLDEILETVYPEFEKRDISYMKSQYLLRKQKELITHQIATFSQPKFRFSDKDNNIEEEIKLITKKKKMKIF